jgi:PAS domain S-box-containing protein
MTPNIAGHSCDTPAMDWLSFADAAGVALWQRNLATGKLYFGEQAGRLFGCGGGGEYDRSAVLERLHPEDRDRVRAAFDAAVAAGSMVEVDFRVLSAGGARWVRSTGRVVTDRDGHPEWLAGLAIDITESRRTLEERESGARFRLAAHAATDVIYEWDIAADRVAVYGDGAGRLGFGPSAAPQRYADFMAMVHPEDRTRVAGAIEASLQGGEYTCQYRVTTKSGEIRHWHCKGRMLAAGDGTPLRQVGVITDVTDKVVAEQRISEMNSALRELSARLMRSQDEERRRFARDLHDSTAQSLTALSFSIKLVADMPGVASNLEASTGLLDCAAMVEACIREVRTMSYLLHPILLDDLGLKPALRNFAAGFERRTGIAVRFHSSATRERWPDAIQTTTFRFVQEALSNVLRHAAATEVLVDLSDSADGLTVQVIDNGGGFPPEVLNGSGTLVGSGVGIAGMRDRARSLGGVVTIQSSSQGSTLQLVIPIDDAN